MTDLKDNGGKEKDNFCKLKVQQYLLACIPIVKEYFHCMFPSTIRDFFCSLASGKCGKGCYTCQSDLLVSHGKSDQPRPWWHSTSSLLPLNPPICLHNCPSHTICKSPGCELLQWQYDIAVPMVQISRLSKNSHRSYVSI